jgi:hypothetical protein
VLWARSKVFIYDLFNDTVSSTGYKLSNGVIMCDSINRENCDECKSAYGNSIGHSKFVSRSWIKVMQN